MKLESPVLPAAWQAVPWHAVAGTFACIVLFTLPFSHSVAVRSIAMALAWVATLAAWRRLAVPGVPPLLWLFAVWGLLGLVSLTWAVDLKYSADELKKEVGYTALTFVLFFAITDARWLERFRLVLMGTTLLALVSALYWAAFSAPGKTEGFFNGPGMYTTFLAAVYPFALVWVLRAESSRNERIFHALVMFAIFVGAAVSLNRLIWIVFALQSAFVLAALARRRMDRAAALRAALAACAVFVAAAGALYAVSSQRFSADPAAPEVVAKTAASDPRLRFWAHAAERIAERPFTGAGFGRGALRQDFREAFGHGLYWHAHNTVLNAGLAMGVWGLAVILAVFGLVFARLWRIWREADPLTGATPRGATPPRTPLSQESGVAAFTIAPYALAGAAMVIGMFLRNMTDDLFIRQSALLYWALAGAIFGTHLRLRRG